MFYDRRLEQRALAWGLGIGLLDGEVTTMDGFELPASCGMVEARISIVSVLYEGSCIVNCSKESDNPIPADGCPRCARPKLVSSHVRPSRCSNNNVIAPTSLPIYASGEHEVRYLVAKQDMLVFYGVIRASSVSSLSIPS